MQENEFDESRDQTEDQMFYRDSFGEKITREGENEPMMADTDSEVASDEADEENDDMEPVVEPEADNGFRETLDDVEPMAEPSDMEDVGSDFEDKSAEDEDMTMSEKIRERYNTPTGEDQP